MVVAEAMAEMRQIHQIILLLSILLLTFISIAHSQACDKCGASASYSETIGTQSTLKKRTITTSGCPNHYRYESSRELFVNSLN